MTASTETTKYQWLAQSLREQIRSGALQPEDRLPSFSEMRRLHGATPTTVERVYSLLERDGLVKREKGRGVFVAPPQHSRTNGVVGVIGLNGPFTSHPWGIHLLEGIRQAAGRAEKEVLLYFRISQDSTIKWEKVDGVLSLEPASEVVLPYLPIGIPFVSALTKVKGHVSVVADEVGGMRDAVEHLLNLGHRRIAYLIAHKTPDVLFLRPRVTAYQDALRGAGIEPDERWLRHLNGLPPYRECGYHNMAQWLADDWYTLGCTALLAQNDDVAVGVMQALREVGLRVPEDISVVGFDGTEIGEYCTPHLTSVAVPLREIGVQAMQLLLQQMRDEPAQFASLELPAHLEVRASTAVPGMP